MKKILVSLSMGMSVRNLLHSGFMEELAASYDVTLASPFYNDPHLIELLHKSSGDIKSVPLYVPRFKSRLSRWFYSMNYLGHWFEKRPIQIKKHLEKMRTSGTSKFYLHFILAYIYLKCIKRKNNFDWIRDAFFYVNLEKIYGVYDEIFVASTDQNIDQIYAYSAARDGKRVHALVHSWDNLTSRGFLITKELNLLVWNQKMKDDARLYQNMKEEFVHVVGVPQFEVYKTITNESSRLDLEKRMNVKPPSRIVTFCCSAERVFPDEELLVDWFVENLRKEITNESNIILILRLHPDARQEYYIKKYSSFSNVRLSIPDKSFKAKYIKQLSGKEGLKEFSELMRFSDVIINLASTTALDAICSGTPAIGIKFNLTKVAAWEMASKHYVESSHYDEILKYEAIPLVESKRELIQTINTTFLDPHYREKERDRLRKAFSPYSNSKERLINAIKN